MILKKVLAFINKEKLFSAPDKILVAISGGADSVALLRILISLGFTCEGAHCNFHLRGEESNRDEEFTHKMCHDLNVPYHIIHFDTKEYALRNKISIEMAARELRYEWFAQLMKEVNAKIIGVAHHQDDSIETILLNLIRGTGINGLTGIRPKNGDIVRPLLCVSRKEITGYLKRIGQEYVTDSTNLSDEFTRNKIRLKLLPLLQEMNPSIRDTLIETAKNLNGVSIIYNESINKGKSRVLTTEGISIEKLMEEPSPKALLFEILYPLGFNSAQIDSISNSIHGQPGKSFLNKTKDVRVIKDRSFLLIDRPQEPHETEMPPFELSINEYPYTPEFIIPREKFIACFDKDKIKGSLTIRKWKNGDFFIPFGMNGKKLISDYLTDKKISISQKEKQWVLCNNEHIIWLIGERTDNRYRIDEKTRNILVASINEK